MPSVFTLVYLKSILHTASRVICLNLNHITSLLCLNPLATSHHSCNENPKAYWSMRHMGSGPHLLRPHLFPLSILGFSATSLVSWTHHTSPVGVFVHVLFLPAASFTQICRWQAPSCRLGQMPLCKVLSWHPHLESLSVSFAPSCFPQVLITHRNDLFNSLVHVFISIFAKKNVRSKRMETFSCSQWSPTPRIAHAYRRHSANICWINLENDTANTYAVDWLLRTRWDKWTTIVVAQAQPRVARSVVFIFKIGK